MPDEGHLLNIFPENVWKLVLKQVRNPAVLKNVSNAFPYFRKLLSSRRTDFLFPEVWKALVVFSNSDRYLQEITAKDSGSSKSRRGLLRLRLVSRCWRHTIDSSYKSQAYLNEYVEPDLTDPLDVSLVTVNFQFPPSHSSNSVVGFLQHFEHTHGNGPVPKNPFLANKINLMLPNTLGLEHHRGGRDDYIRNVTKILSKYGRHLFICHLYVVNPGNSEQKQFYIQISQWLKLMPYLSSLHILYSNCNSPNLEDKEGLEWGIAASPLGNLPHLKNLITTNLCPDLFNHLISVQNHVSNLEVRAGLQAEYEVHSAKFLNLRRLYISYDKSPHLFKKLKNAQFGTALRTLKLRGEVHPEHLRKMFRILRNGVGGNLNHLKLIILLAQSGSTAVAQSKKAADKKLNVIVMGAEDGDRNVDTGDAGNKVWDKAVESACHLLINEFLPNVSIFELKFELKNEVKVA